MRIGDITPFVQEGACHFTADHVLGLCRLGWCSVQLSHCGQHLFQQLATEISRRSERLSPLDASQLAWAMARAEYRCEQLLWQLHGDLLHQLPHCDGRHLANMLWSFAKLSCALLQGWELCIFSRQGAKWISS